jgi:hypothetical protein
MEGDRALGLVQHDWRGAVRHDQQVSVVVVSARPRLTGCGGEGILGLLIGLVSCTESPRPGLTTAI